MEIKYKTFYGEEFDSEKECIEAEKKRMQRTFYVKIYSNPDLTETGRMLHLRLFRIYSEKIQKEICVFLIIKELKISLIGESVQGYGYQGHCYFSFIDEIEFNNPEPIIWGGRALEFRKYDVVIQENTIIKKL